jgi:hypothetical protein
MKYNWHNNQIEREHEEVVISIKECKQFHTHPINATLLPKKYAQKKKKEILYKSFVVYHATNFSAACLNILAARSSCPCASTHLPSYIASLTAGK